MEESAETKILEFKHGDARPDWPSNTYRKSALVCMWRMDQPFRCHSREGVLDGQPGDFLAADGHGGFYPISAEFHAANYELVVEGIKPGEQDDGQ